VPPFANRKSDTGDGGGNGLTIKAELMSRTAQNSKKKAGMDTRRGGRKPEVGLNVGGRKAKVSTGDIRWASFWGKGKRRVPSTNRRRSGLGWAWQGGGIFSKRIGCEGQGFDETKGTKRRNKCHKKCRDDNAKDR